MAWQVLQLGLVFSVNLACKKEQNLMVKMNETSSQGAVGFELRGTDSFLPILFFISTRHDLTSYKVQGYQTG